MSKSISRRKVLGAGAGAALTSAVGIHPKFIRPAHAKTGLAAGMTGGPTGFPGAERFQYNESISEGRAIEGMKKLKAAGKAPKQIVMLLTDGAIGQITKPFPKGAPSVKEVWEKETGVEIKIIGAPADKIWTRVLQDVTTRSGAYDIYTQPWNSVGDLVEANGAADLTEFVDKYKPDWGDPDRGTPSKQIEELLYKYNGRYYTVSLDGDFQTWVYNKKAFADPKNREAFKAKYGHELAPPRTWKESDHISEFFTGRTGITGKKMYGNGNMMSPFWGLPIFYARMASQAMPNLYWFDDDGNPNLDSDLGIKAAQEHVKMKGWSHPDILSWTYAEGYGAMANGTTAHISTYTNLAKFYDRKKADGSPASPIADNLGAYLPPGRQFGDQLVRRSVIYYNINAEVSSQSKNKEAAYLFIQWLTSPTVSLERVMLPYALRDPYRLSHYVSEEYRARWANAGAYLDTLKSAADTCLLDIVMPGSNEYHVAIDQMVTSAQGGSSVEDALASGNSAFNEITDRIGRESQKAAYQEFIKLKGSYYE